MPVITCGGMRFQQGWGDFDPATLDAENQKNLEATVMHAFELGINHFETARGYGSSEYQLGLVLPRLPRDEIIIQTKIGIMQSEEEFLAAFDKSISNLQVEQIDLLAIHGINSLQGLDNAIKNGSLSACKKLKEQGRIKHIGFSTHAGPQTIIAALETEEFSYVNLHWYYIDQRNISAIEEAAARDVGVLIISPCDKGGQLFKPSDKLVKLCEPLHPMEFNDLFCLQNKAVHTLSIGAARPSDLDLHANIVESIDNTDLQPVLTRLHNELVATLGAFWVEHWSDGLPIPEDNENEVCVYHILRLYNLVKAFDMVEFGKYRYNLLGNGGTWFPGMKASEENIKNISKILAGNPMAGKIIDILQEAHKILDDTPVERLSVKKKAK